MTRGLTEKMVGFHTLAVGYGSLSMGDNNHFLPFRLIDDRILPDRITSQ